VDVSRSSLSIEGEDIGNINLNSDGPRSVTATASQLWILPQKQSHSDSRFEA